ncbi:uncharacterized protein LOC141590291 [Silene latifolia]|uniref:uncharacterized protein LOC141590291 n=1 Tax=Silene latifolia TaxID=37657 RepID=UPI003D789302
MKNRSILDYLVKGRKSHKPTLLSFPLSQSVEHPSQTQELNQHEQHEIEPSLTPIQEVDQNEHEYETDPSSTPTQVGGNPGFMPCQEEEFDVDLLTHDPGKQKPILSYPINDQDVIRRLFIDKKPCRPKPKADFPQTPYGNKLRRFKAYWSDKYDWLEYSELNDAAFCFFCYLFKDTTNASEYDPFVDGGHKNWKKALETFEKHEGGFAFEIRSSIPRDESATSNNKGNFLELLEWLAGKSENVAKIVLISTPGNHQATAPSIKKDLIKCYVKETTRLIVESLDNDLFAILADEFSDVSHKEQMAICLRYLDNEGYVAEGFLGAVKVDDTSSKTLMATIKKLLANHSLSMSNIRGQGYDGTSNIRGALNGLRNLIMRNNPCAYYVHCFAHQLQLTVVAVAK